MTRPPFRFTLNAAITGLALSSLVACSTVDDIASGGKVDYRSAQTKPTPLEVPPDLSQLAVDPRYAPQAGVISAAALQASGNPAAGTPGAPAGAATPTATPVAAIPAAAVATSTSNSVAPAAVGEVRIVSLGGMRYLSTPLTAEQLWPQLEAFWKERGLTLSLNQPELGLMETEWAENRVKLPQDIIRRTIGKVFDSLYSTGERDKYRTRVERTERGTDVYIAHRGLEEIYTNQTKENTTWTGRPSDPSLESEMLARLMVKLGVKDETARAAAAASTTPGANTTAAAVAPARARVLQGQPAATLQLDESFDRAWRRIGLALDRSGFTVEDRDRAQGLYYVRYVDPAEAGKEEPGFWSRTFGSGKKLVGPIKYRVAVKGDGNVSTAAVYDAQGNPENGDAGKRIVQILVDDLK